MKRWTEDAPVLRSSRRAFLEFLALEVTLLTVGCSNGRPDIDVDPGSPAVSRATGYGGEQSVGQLTRIGRAYLDDDAGDNAQAEVDGLVALLDAYPTDEAAVDGLVAAVRDDFLNGHLRNVEGWTLSATECALCALLASAA